MKEKSAFTLHPLNPPRDFAKNGCETGFTLIEMSIVLIIIGLIVGGILVGRDLMKAAAIRATIAQVEKYNTAANTFFEKYGGLPGDLNATAAAQFGFVTRAGTQGRGDGNGLLEAWDYTGHHSSLQWPFNGEPSLFWVDLSKASFLDETFRTATDAEPDGGGILNVQNPGQPTAAYAAQYVPYPKCTSTGLLFVYSYTGRNYFTISGITTDTGTQYVVDGDGHVYTALGLTVAQSYAFDNKVDDAIPTSGNVQAIYLGAAGNYPQSAPSGSSDSPSTCYNSSTNTYSLTQNNGNGVNCALSFKMQAGD